MEPEASESPVFSETCGHKSLTTLPTAMLNHLYDLLRTALPRVLSGIVGDHVHVVRR